MLRDAMTIGSKRNRQMTFSDAHTTFSLVNIPLYSMTRSYPLLYIFLFCTYSFYIFGNTHAEILVPLSNDSYPDREAAFGGQLDAFGIEGRLIPISYLDPLNREFGCWPVLVPSIRRELQIIKTRRLSVSYAESIESYPAKNDDPWIALVSRGDCSFAQKIRSMQESGASAVIVGDNALSMDLITMHAEGDLSDIIIPSVFISRGTYRDLRFQVSSELLGLPNAAILLFNDTGLHVHISKNDEIEIPVLDVVFITILSIATPIVVLGGLFYIWSLIRARQVRLAESHVDTSFLISLPTHIYYKEKSKDIDPTTCAICLDDFEDDDELRVLIRCIDPWLLTKSKECPICKRNVTLTEELEEPTEETALLITTD